MRKTKIVCTIGPACDSVSVIRGMLEAGMDVARLNYSHGTPQKHASAVEKLRVEAKKQGKHLALLVDLPGPKTRIGVVENNSIRLLEGKKIVLTTRQVVGTPEEVTVNLDSFPKLVSENKIIFLADGMIELKVLKKRGEDVECLVVVGGELNSRKGITIPGAFIPAPALSKRDFEGINFAVKHEVDFIAQSFVRNASDVRELKKILKHVNKKRENEIRVISKIEDSLALKNIDEIIAESDGVMIARGDLGVQIPFQDVPFAQKTIIRKCNEAAKPVITATQMLESMIRSPQPTRAEVTDVANAILDGTDAVMLSGETATGEYPVRTVKVMNAIAERTDALVKPKNENAFKSFKERGVSSVPRIVGSSIVHSSELLDASAILACTVTGKTARFISSFKPSARVIAVTPNESEARKLNLCWGVTPLLTKIHPATIKNPLVNTDVLVRKILESAFRRKFLRKGEVVLITAGIPLGLSGESTLFKILKV